MRTDAASLRSWFEDRTTPSPRPIAHPDAEDVARMPARSPSAQKSWSENDDRPKDARRLCRDGASHRAETAPRTLRAALDEFARRCAEYQAQSLVELAERGEGDVASLNRALALTADPKRRRWIHVLAADRLISDRREDAGLVAHLREVVRLGEGSPESQGWAHLELGLRTDGDVALAHLRAAERLDRDPESQARVNLELALRGDGDVEARLSAALALTRDDALRARAARARRDASARSQAIASPALPVWGVRAARTVRPERAWRRRAEAGYDAASAQLQAELARDPLWRQEPDAPRDARFDHGSASYGRGDDAWLDKLDAVAAGSSRKPSGSTAPGEPATRRRRIA